ncbi:MAG: hypothetical protein OCC49_01925 [Fibrobacterales bacterium]
MKPNRNDLIDELCQESTGGISLSVVIVVLGVCILLIVTLSLFSNIPTYGLLGVGVVVLGGLYGYARSFSKKTSQVKRDILDL